MSYVFGGLVAALVIIYMARPNFRRAIMSAAVFFQDDPVVGSTSRIAWSTPRPTPLFYPQLIVLLLLLFAIPQCRVAVGSEAAREAGVWVLIDRSASMSTIQNGATRMEHAVAALRDRMSSQRMVRCFKLSMFDLEITDVRDNIRTIGELVDAASELRPRPVGTQLSLVERALSLPPRGSPDTCPIDVAVVLTDMPAPPWMDRAASSGDVWIDVSQRVANAGLTDLIDVRDQITGRVERVRLRVETFGGMAQHASLTVTSPDSKARVYEVTQWDGPTGVVELIPDLPGRYSIRLSPGGAYRYDDEAAIDVPAAGPVKVAWNASHREWLTRLGWVEDAGAPDLRILPSVELLDSRPAIVVGSGYSRRTEAVQPITTFLETSPLLFGLNFDVAERAGMAAAASLPPGFAPVLGGRDGAVWIAERTAPLAVYVPGLPLDGDDNVARFSSTVFFNAARWVLQRRPLPALFSLTSPEMPEPSGNRIALHPGEGNTERTPRSIGTFNPRVHRGQPIEQQRERWPWLLAVAALTFLVERGLALVRGLS
jgi:hypothetical protein